MQHIVSVDNQEGSKPIDPKLAIPKNGPFWTYLIIASKGQGKTTLWINLINKWLKGYYDRIYLISGTADRDDKCKDLIEELDRTGRFFDEYSEDIQKRVNNEIQANNDRLIADDKKPRNLIIYDDVISQLPPSTEKHSAFNKMIVGARHMKTDLIIISQQFRRLSNLIRANTDIISIFPTMNKKEIKAYLDELNVDANEFLQLLNEIQKKRHTFLTINFLTGAPKFFHNFDPLF